MTPTVGQIVQYKPPASEKADVGFTGSTWPATVQCAHGDGDATILVMAYPDTPDGNAWLATYRCNEGAAEGEWTP